MYHTKLMFVIVLALLVGCTHSGTSTPTQADELAGRTFEAIQIASDIPPLIGPNFTMEFDLAGGAVFDDGGIAPIMGIYIYKRTGFEGEARIDTITHGQILLYIRWDTPDSGYYELYSKSRGLFQVGTFNEDLTAPTGST